MIRQAVEADAGAIARIYNHSIGNCGYELKPIIRYVAEMAGKFKLTVAN